MPRYADFSISFGTGTGGRYPITARSLAGSSEGTFELPVPFDRLHELLLSVGAAVRDTGTTRAVIRESTQAAPQDLGVNLFTALFTDRVRDNFMESLGRAERDNAVLRVRLQMNLDNPTVAPLASLPWELLHDPARRKNLVEWPATSVVRYLDVLSPNDLPAYSPPLSILFVMANPRGDLNLAAEREGIEARLARSSVPTMRDFLEGATFSKLTNRLHEQDYHIVHFMGHGGFADGNGVLMLETDSGSGEDRLTGVELGRLLLAERVRLVVLNACRTAQTVANPGADPYRGVAPALVMAGVPAVVAMQLPISDNGAMEFADRLYSTLARGDSIEAAVREGRRAIRAEWPIPVLFSRCDDDLFPDRTGGVRPAQVSAVSPSRLRSSRVGVAADEDLLPYLVDRTELLFQLDQLLRKQETDRSIPAVAVIHGDDAQAQDKLLQRLREVELPKLLRLNAREEALSAYQLQWPEQGYQGRDDLHQRLTWALAGRVQNGLTTPEELQELFGALPAPVMIYSQVLSTEWERYPATVLDDYVAYWQSWPGAAARQRIVAFLFVKYQSGERGWWKSRRSQRTKEAIAGLLDTLKAASPDKVFVKVLPRLGGIRQQDVETWNADHGYPMSEDEIRELFRAHLPPNEQELSMETIGRLLRERLVWQKQALGGAA